MVLALTLLVLLAGLSVMALGAWRGSRVLEDGAGRIESALRMARAEAANQGRRVRLTFQKDGAQPEVEWEADPLTKPGEFAAMTACTWQDYIAMDGVRVERCDLVGPSTQRPSDWGAELQAEVDEETMTIIFQPDGSSDSATIELSALAAGDPRRAVINLNGRIGTITVEIMSASETEQP
jgi:Tfp pilus assembly protein FimT